MTDVDMRDVPAGRSAELEAQAAAWVRRQYFDDWSAADRHALDQWLNESVAHQVAYWRIQAGFEATKRLAALRTPMRTQGTASASRKRRPLTLSMAAALVTVSLVSVGASFMFFPKQKTYITPIGGQEIIRLADGSQIELNTNTKLRTENSFFGGRRVWLDRGEAYFDIKHDDDHPFIVFASRHRLTDLGTKFSVRAGDDRVRVALIEGAIRLESIDASKHQRATLVTGDVAVADAKSVSVRQAAAPQLKREESWRRGLLIFQRTTLADAVAEFNRYNPRKLRVRDANVAKLRIGGTFSADNPTLFAQANATMLGLRVILQGNELVLER